MINAPLHDPRQIQETTRSDSRSLTDIDSRSQQNRLWNSIQGTIKELFNVEFGVSSMQQMHNIQLAYRTVRVLHGALRHCSTRTHTEHTHRAHTHTVDTATRLLALLEVTAKATPSLEERIRCGRMLVAERLLLSPSERSVGFEHGVRRTENGGRMHWYRFVGDAAQREAAARRMHQHRLTPCDFDVRGDEPYPGMLFSCGQLFQPHGGRTRSVGLEADHLIRMPHARDADFTQGVAALPPATQSALKALRAARQREPTMHTLEFVRRCLLAHHLSTRCSEVHAVYEAAIDVAPPEEHEQLKYEQTFFMDPRTERTHIFASLLRRANPRASRHLSAWLPAPMRGYDTVLRWYREQCGDAAWDRVEVYDKLFYAGEEFGSDLAHGGKNAWISGNFHGPDAAGGTAVWFGRVSFYVRHHFADRAHDFAVVRWLDFAENQFEQDVNAFAKRAHDEAEAKRAAQREAEAKRRARERRDCREPDGLEQAPAAVAAGQPAPGPAFEPERATPSSAPAEQWPWALESVLELQNTFADYPIVSLAPRKPDVRDIIPVHRITGRWIAMSAATMEKRRAEPSISTYQYVCPIRSRMHG